MKRRKQDPLLKKIKRMSREAAKRERLHGPSVISEVRSTARNSLAENIKTEEQARIFMLLLRSI